MTAEPMHPARGRSRAIRLPSSLCAVLLVACALAGCHDDDDRVTLAPAAAEPHTSAAPLAEALNSGANAPSATIAILASPARPLKQADALNVPAVAPLAPPVIHTVD